MRYRQLTSPITFGITQSIVGVDGGPLDLVPGAAAAYSTRRLRFGYTGPAVRVRRSSDNAEADIGFDGAGNLDQAALMNHVGYQNLFTYSEQFDNAAWTKAGATITANSTTAPNNTLTADTLTTTSTASTYCYQLQTPSGVNTFSIFAKQGTNRYIWMYFGLTNNNYGVLFDLQTGTVATSISKGSVTQASNSISAEANGFYRCSITANVGVAQVYQAFSGTNNIPVTTTSNNDLNNATNGTIFVWGAQLNSGETAQTYQQTVATAATGNGFVTTWYDQSGNARNPEQTTASNQPRIVNAGVLETLNGKPKLFFDGTNDSLMASYTSINFNGVSVYALANLSSATAANSGVVCFSDGTNFDYITNGIIGWAAGFTGGLPSGADARYNTASAGVANVALAMNTTYVYSFHSNSGIRINGTLTFAGNNGVTQIANTTTVIGARALPGPSLPGRVDVSEVIVFNTISNATDRQTLERNQGNYYGIAVA